MEGRLGAAIPKCFCRATFVKPGSPVVSVENARLKRIKPIRQLLENVNSHAVIDFLTEIFYNM